VSLVIERDPAARPTAEQRPYAPRGAALELLRYRGREVLVAGPSGTGKSRACLTKLDLVCTQLPIRAAIVRKVRVSLTQSTLVTMNEKVLPQPSGVVFHGGDQEYRYPNGARIAVFGLDDPRKALSAEFDLIYVGEATRATGASC
jgi:phage terminase large subunit